MDILRILLHLILLIVYFAGSNYKYKQGRKDARKELFDRGWHDCSGCTHKYEWDGRIPF